jgi:hypothetical protein
MRADQDQSTDRRRWLEHGLRTVLLAALGWLSWTLGQRSRHAACREPQAACRHCGRLAQCGDPQARSARQHSET